jgi:Flp pilus assembly protein TadD
MPSANPQAELLFDEATEDVALGEMETAADKFQKCTQLDPDFFDAWHALGMVLMKIGKLEEAIRAGCRAVEIKENDQLAWSSLSLFYVKNGQIAEAESAGAKARVLGWKNKLSGSDLREPNPDS